jgi:peptide/nickel transport system substrate-binding protein
MPFFISRRTSIFADPENWLSPLASCDQSSVQGIFFCDPQLDVLIDQSAQTANPDVRNQVYEQIGEIYAEDVPVIPIFWDAEFLVKRAGIQIEPAAPGSLLNFSTIQLDENILTASGRPDTLVIGTTMLPEVLNPYEAAHPNEFEIIYNTSLLLLRFSHADASWIPEAAVDLPQVSEDGLTYTFTLRDDLIRDDEQTLNANHYVEAWESLTASDHAISRVFDAYIKNAEALDDLTLVYHLNQPYSFFPALVASPALVPSNSPGAYQVIEVLPGERVVLEANPSYVGRTPLVRTLVIQSFPNSAQLADALEAGEVDLAWRSLEMVDLFRFENDADWEINQIDLATLYFLVFNHNFLVVTD